MVLPDPPLWERLLLEQPWPVTMALLVLTLFLAVRSIRRASKRELLIALVPLVLATASLLTARFVVTPREQMVARTQELVRVTAPLDLPALRGMFEPHATLSGPDATVWLEFDALFTELEQALQRYPVRHHDVQSVAAASESPDRGQTLLNLRTIITGPMEFPTHTQWLISWAREPGQPWRVTKVQWMEFEGKPPQVGMWR